VPDAPPSVPESERFGQFVRTEKLGAGGMGEVWKAWDTALSRWVALKMLRKVDDEEIARFTREAQVAAGLAHPNIAAIYCVGQDRGRHFIAMQYVEGTTIGRLPRGDRRRLVQFVRDAAGALAYAHDQGIVHRDIKPDNLMATPDGRVFVLDFGLARPLRAPSRLSVSGLLVGTPAYMPPEQARGEKVDARADVYSLGATLYQLLTGRPPFEGDDLIAILSRVASDDPRAPRAIDARIERDLETIVLKCMEKDRGRRYASASGLADDLGRWLDGEPVRAGRPSFFCRLRKRLLRRPALAAAAVCAAAIAVLVPVLARERAARVVAEREAELWTTVSRILADAELSARHRDVDRARALLERGIASCRDFLRAGDRPSGRYFLARLLRARGDEEAAIRELDRALELDGSFVEARLERGVLRTLVYSSTRRPRGGETRTLRAMREGAQQDLGAPVAAGRYVREPDVLFGRAMLPYAQGEWARARDALEELLRVDRLHVDALIQLAWTHLMLGSAAAARDAGDRAVDVHRGEARAVHARGLARLMAGDASGAEADFSEAIALRPEWRNARRMRAGARARRGEHEAALADLEELLRSAPDDAEALCARAAVYGARGDHARALADAEAAIRFDPGLVEAHVTRAGALDAMGRLDEALAGLDAALRIAPNAVGYLRRASIATRRRQFDAALADCERALALDPALVDAHVERGLAHKGRGDLDAAWRAYEEALRVDPKHAHALSNRASIRMERADPDGAIRDLDAAIALRPAFAMAWRNRGTARTMKKDWAGAVADYTEAIRLQADFADAYADRGWARYNLRDVDGCIGDFEKSLQVGGPDWDRRGQAEDALRTLGKKP